MIKILFFNNTYPSKKYPQKAAYAKAIYEMLFSCGFEMSLCVKECCEKKITVKFISYFRYFITLFRVDLSKYDILYINHYLFLIPLFFRIPFYKKKVLFHWHGEELVNDRIVLKVLRYIAARTIPKKSLHISPSNYYKKIICKKMDIEMDKIFIYPSGGVDMDIFLEDKHEKYNEFHIGFPAALNAHKGITYLYSLLDHNLKLEKRLERKVYYHVINYGSNSLDFIKYLSVNKISNVFVHDLYDRKELYKYYNQIDVTLFLSKRESLGLTVLESMACGVPVIALNNTSMPELVIPHYTGELIENTPTVYNLIEYITYVCNNPTKYNTRDFVEKNFSSIKAKDILFQLISSYNNL